MERSGGITRCHQAKLRKEEPSGKSSNNFRPGTTHRQPSAQLRACSGHVEVPKAEKLRTHDAQVKTRSTPASDRSFQDSFTEIGKAKDIFDTINAMKPDALSEGDLVQFLVNGLREAQGNPYHRLIERMDERFRDGDTSVYTFTWFRSELLAKELFVRSNRKPTDSPKQETATSTTAYFSSKGPKQGGNHTHKNKNKNKDKSGNFIRTYCSTGTHPQHR